MKTFNPKLSQTATIYLQDPVSGKAHSILGSFYSYYHEGMVLVRIVNVNSEVPYKAEDLSSRILKTLKKLKTLKTDRGTFYTASTFELFPGTKAMEYSLVEELKEILDLDCPSLYLEHKVYCCTCHSHIDVTNKTEEEYREHANSTQHLIFQQNQIMRNIGLNVPFNCQTLITPEETDRWEKFCNLRATRAYHKKLGERVFMSSSVLFVLSKIEEDIDGKDSKTMSINGHLTVDTLIGIAIRVPPDEGLFHECRIESVEAAGAEILRRAGVQGPELLSDEEIEEFIRLARDIDLLHSISD